jgi:F-type H+-transporting ATPase subunit k
VFGRAIKNEYLSLATIFGTAGLVFGARAAFSKKEKAKPKTAGSVIERVKEAIPINAGSKLVSQSFVSEPPTNNARSEEEQL